MEFQTIDDLVDHLALGAHGEPDQIEVGALDRPHRVAVSGIMRRLEHILGIDRRRDATRQRPLQCPRQRRAIGSVDQDRLSDQRETEIGRP